MTDKSVSPHAQVWAQAFTPADPSLAAPLAERGDAPRPTRPPRAAMELADEFPAMPGEETEPPAQDVAPVVEDTSAFDDLFEELATPAAPLVADVPAATVFPPVPPAASPAPDAPAPASVAAGNNATPFPPAAPEHTSPAPAAAPASPVAAMAPAPSPPPPTSRRYSDHRMLSVYVTHLRDVIGSDVGMTDMVRDFILTSDRDVDVRQQRALVEALSALLSRAPADVTSKLPPSAQWDTVLEILYDDLIGIGPLGPLWRDAEVTEIIVRGPETVLVERVGTQLVRDAATFRDLDHLKDTARQLARQISGRSLSPTNPLVTAELPGARVQFVFDPLTKDGVFLAIRKFRPLLSMQALIDNQSLTVEMAEFLRDIVAARGTICCSGGTGSGKTSMLNALSEFINPIEHIVTIEDAYELKLTHPNVTAMQTKEKASADDDIVVKQAELLVAALRMRPDRIIVGEIREGHGADTMMRAAGTGHDGSMTTIHANNPESAMSDRLPDLLLEHKNVPMDTARRAVANAIDAVVHVTKRSGRRFVSHIAVVDPSMVEPLGLHPRIIFRYDGYTAEQVGRVDADSDLGIRMTEAHVGQRWLDKG